MSFERCEKAAPIEAALRALKSLFQIISATAYNYLRSDNNQRQRRGNFGGNTMRYAYFTCLSLVGAALACEVFSLFIYTNPTVHATQLGRVIVIGCIFIGIVLFSQVARFVGLIFMGGSAAYTIFGIVTSNARVALIFTTQIVFSTIFSVVAVYFLGLSKSFAIDFRERRANASSTVAFIRMGILGLIIVCVLWLVAVDVAHLTRAWTRSLPIDRHKALSMTPPAKPLQ